MASRTGKRGGGRKTPRTKKRGTAKKSAKRGRAASRASGRSKSARKASAAKRTSPRKQSPVARVKRVTREVVQQATVAVSAGVETLKDLGGTLVERVRS